MNFILSVVLYMYSTMAVLAEDPDADEENDYKTKIHLSDDKAAVNHRKNEAGHQNRQQAEEHLKAHIGPEVSAVAERVQQAGQEEVSHHPRT